MTKGGRGSKNSSFYRTSFVNDPEDFDVDSILQDLRKQLQNRAPPP